ncbi:hypothetical protein EGW08_011328 [Elysia chlorotica]|uniref:Uncharacterized protein n=1 Tax=Elysia chlorotica TaxID=188477 RepID=A0A433THD3_ELYCH|nr:hypothetical protein EGW08_011328 [Elysia chlorotica]
MDLASCVQLLLSCLVSFNKYYTSNDCRDMKTAIECVYSNQTICNHLLLREEIRLLNLAQPSPNQSEQSTQEVHGTATRKRAKRHLEGTKLVANGQQEKVGIDGKTIQLIANLYWHQKAAIRIQGELSDYTPIKRGVRQGCVLSPYLFNIYTIRLLDLAQPSPNQSEQSTREVHGTATKKRAKRHVEGTELVAKGQQGYEPNQDGGGIQNKKLDPYANTWRLDGRTTSSNVYEA